MPLDPSIALQVQSPNPQNFISGFLDLGQKKLNLDKARETYSADVSQRKAEASLANTTADVAAQTAPSTVARAKIAQNLDQFKLTGAQGAQAMQLASGLISDPAFVNADPKGMTQRLNEAYSTMTQQFGISPEIADANITTLKYQALHDPAQVRQSLINMTQQQQGGSGQQAAALPAPAMVNNGQSIQPLAAGNPALTGVPTGTPQGVPTQLQPPPTTQVFNPVKQQPELLGAQPGGVAPGAIATGPALGVSGAVDANIATNTTHRAQVQANADAAGTKLAALQTIKQEVPTALTGHGDAGDFLRYLSKLWGGDTATSNDVMAKNLAIIAGNAGNTDAARALGEMGTPNYHMTPEAAQKTAEQLMGILRKDQAAGQLFGTLQPNDPGYAAKRDLWNRNADPRAFEFAAKSQSERAQMKFEMKKAGTWDALNAKMHTLDAMGVNP